MKNYNEMANDVIRRIGEYESDRKRKRRILTRTVSSLCCVCLVALMGFGVWQGGWFDSIPPIMLNDPVHNGEQDYSSETNNNNTTNNTVEDPMKVFNVISLSQGNIGEFAADIYRPEGFNDNIGSVLALKMSIVEDANYEFPVIVRIPDKTNLEQVLNDANNSVNMTINIAEASLVSISGEMSTTDKYYYLLTAEQIIALADSGAKCYYVGSGEGDYKNMNWDTVEGINAYCELHGDMYIASDNNVEHTSDIWSE